MVLLPHLCLLIFLLSFDFCKSQYIFSPYSVVETNIKGNIVDLFVADMFLGLHLNFNKLKGSKIF